MKIFNFTGFEKIGEGIISDESLVITREANGDFFVFSKNAFSFDTLDYECTEGAREKMENGIRRSPFGFEKSILENLSKRDFEYERQFEVYNILPSGSLEKRTARIPEDIFKRYRKIFSKGGNVSAGLLTGIDRLQNSRFGVPNFRFSFMVGKAYNTLTLDTKNDGYMSYGNLKEGKAYFFVYGIIRGKAKILDAEEIKEDWYI